MLQRFCGGVYQAPRLKTNLKKKKVKFFLGMGAVQLPGVIKEDLSDCKRAVELLADMLGAPHPPASAQSIKMLNNNFKVEFRSKDECLNLAALHIFFRTKPQTMFGSPVRLSVFDETNVKMQLLCTDFTAFIYRSG